MDLRIDRTGEVTTSKLRLERRLMLGFAGITLLLAFSPAARFLVLLLPLGALGLAARTVQKYTGLYLQFVCWLFFLAPLVRRMVEFRANVSATVIVATPFFVLLFALGLLVARWRRVLVDDCAPFAYALAAILYGVLIAFVHFRFLRPVSSLPEWLLPVCCGLYVLDRRESLSNALAGFQSAMLGGTLFAGIYGIIQYFWLPPWDAAWMRQAEIVSIGIPEPMQVRVFSTMNSPQILAAFLMVGIVLAYQARSRWRLPVIIAGLVSLVLSSARSSWVGLLAAILYLAIRSTLKERIRIVTVTTASALLLLGLTQIPDMAQNVTSRFDSLTNLSHDDSAQERSETYAKLSDSLTHSPFGLGLGGDSAMNDAANDSSIVNAVLSLGVPGALVLFADIGLFAVALVLKPGRDLPQLLGLQACLVGLIVEIPVNNVIAGQIAFLTWAVFGFIYAIDSERAERRQAAAKHLKVEPIALHG